MPKYEISGSVRIDGKVYRKGEEEALSKVLNEKTAKSLVERGVITAGSSEPQAAPAQEPPKPKSETK